MDPVVARVNKREIHQSALKTMMGQSSSVKEALRALVRRALLNQEADGSGLGRSLPADSTAQAEAFLKRHFSERLLCANFSEREYQEMYLVMKPRFVRGHLYDVSELHWRCNHKTTHDQDGCRTAGQSHANMKWRPILHSIRSADDLQSLQSADMDNSALVFREQVIHRLETGKSNAPHRLADAVQLLKPGSSTIVEGPDGVRLVLLREHRPPIHRQIDDSGVRDEIREELCPRTVQFHRQKYVHDLMKAAWLEVFHEHLPEPHDLPKEPTEGPALKILTPQTVEG